VVSRALLGLTAGPTARLGATLTAVAAAIGLNQVLVTVYLTAVRGGDVRFVTRYLSPGWFDLPRRCATG
jgi:hypothetical protein